MKGMRRRGFLGVLAAVVLAPWIKPKPEPGMAVFHGIDECLKPLYGGDGMGTFWYLESDGHYYVWPGPRRKMTEREIRETFLR